MNKIIKTINLNINEIYLVYVIFGLSIAIFLKDLNLTYLNIPFFETIYFYRGLLFLFSFYLIFVNKKKFNISIFLLSLISFIFLYNIFFGETLIFSTDKSELFERFSIKPHNFFFSEKNSTFIINLFNIYFPLIILIFINFKINLDSFYKISYKFCEIFIFVLTIYICITLIILLYNYQPELGPKKSYFGIQSDFPSHFINPHGLLFFLNIFFIQNFFEIYAKKNIKKNLFYILLIIFLFLISGSILFFGLCTLTLIVYSFFQLKKKYIYTLIILFSLSIFIIYLNLDNSSKIVHGSLNNSIYLRIAYIKFFLFDATNLSYFFGSNIFSENIYTYPHNLLVDIFLCSGLFGIIILSFLYFKIINYYKFKFNYPYNFLILIFFQLSVFSFVSGFFFKNIALNIVLAIMLNLSNVKEEKII